MTVQFHLRIETHTSRPCRSCRRSWTLKMIIEKHNLQQLQYYFCWIHSNTTVITKSLKAHSLDVLVQILLMDWWSFQILSISFFIQVFLWHLQRRFEDIYRVKGGTYYHLVVNWMESYLFYLLLTLMQKHQLVRNLRISLLILH